jgi:TolB-like protein
MNRDPNYVFVHERQDINRYLEEIDRTPGAGDRVSRFRQLGLRLKADYLVVGSAVKYGQKFVVQCRLFSVQQGELVRASASSRECYKEEDIITIVRELGAMMAQQVRARSVGD